jgi:hypothetical protein
MTFPLKIHDVDFHFAIRRDELGDDAAMAVVRGTCQRKRRDALATA